MFQSHRRRSSLVVAAPAPAAGAGAVAVAVAAPTPVAAVVAAALLGDAHALAHFFDGFFKIVVDGFGVKDPKPHPEVFLNGAAALGLQPSSILVFEDAASGIQAAKAGGFTAIGVGNPHVKDAADIYIDDLTEFNLEKYV